MFEFDLSDKFEDDENLPISFNKRRHTQIIEGVNCINQSWRMKDRMKTVSVALVLCLNVGVDPPDIVKIQPCARLECWIDPLSVSPQKALELIGSNLQKQYERWQPRARYKQFLDPTVEDVKKLCTSLRRNAKEERVLFHYNGHGVPRPTINGEIWVFNRTYTQYIPLSIYDLQTWMGAPSIYVYDCSNAGIIVNSFNTFADQHEREIEQISITSTTNNNNNHRNSPPTSSSSNNINNINSNNQQQQTTTTTFKNCIQLAACAANQILPMNPQLPADLFTSCLTTPLRVALKWYTLQATSKLVPQVSYDLIEKIPGQLNDRRTMLGELNWIFTAITDTIAWNTLSRELFQKLFRQDLLVASLFRNFLLAERILRAYDCTPVSSPSLPPGYRHPMWTAWDLALDLALSQLPDILEKGVPFQNLPFFEEQLTAFQVWLERGAEERNPPEQLPIVLQVLLSQVHRLRALELLARFVDMGPWAVNLALSVGIFPYVLKLLQSSARELRPLLVFIWAKILAVDCTCQVDLIRDQGHKYFLSVLQDLTTTAECRTQAAFVLACIVYNFPLGQESAFQGSLVSICLEQRNDCNWKLRQWLAICLGQLWQNYDKARWSGVRDLAHEKLYQLLQDSVPEVRAAAVFALGTFISSVTQRSDHANNIDRSIAMTLWTTVSNDMSPLVRMELNSALQWMVILFENQFVSVFLQEPRILSGQIQQQQTSSTIQTPTHYYTHSLERNINLKRVASSSSLAHMIGGGPTPLTTNNFTTTFGFSSIYLRIWFGINQLANDPHPGVAKMALKIIEHVQNQAVDFKIAKEALLEKSSLSLPPSPNTTTTYLGDSPPKHQHQNQQNQTPETHTTNQIPVLTGKGKRITSTISPRGGSPSQQTRILRCITPNNIVTVTPTNKLSDNIINDKSSNNSLSEHNMQQQPMKSIVTTNYFPWSVSQFARPSKIDDEMKCDKDSIEYLETMEKYKRNAQLRQDAREQYRRVIFGRIDNQTWYTRTQSKPCIVKLHPYESQIAVAYRDKVMVRDWSNYVYSYVPIDNQYKKFNLPFQQLNNQTTDQSTTSCVSSLEFINAHSYSLVLVGYEDGYVRLWRPPKSPGDEPTFVTAWIALADRVESVNINKITNKGPSSHNIKSMATAWYQRDQLLVAGGDARILRLWDADKELKIGDINVGSDSSVRVISIAPNGLIAAGCGDGSVRLFDRRLSQQDCRIMTYREHSGSILTACMRNDCESLVSGCVQGSVRLFDIRKNSSIQNWQVSSDVTAMTVHSIADVMVCGGQGLTVYSLDGQQLSHVRSHEGFMGPKMGQASCLSFHPYKVSVAAGFVEKAVSVFMLDSKKYP